MRDIQWLLCLGWAIRILCYVVMYHARGANATFVPPFCHRLLLGSCIFFTPRHFRSVGLAWTQILNGLGGGISVVCVKVMVQASVPHEDMGIVISNLALWTRLFGAISTAVGAYMLLMSKWRKVNLTDDVLYF